MNVLSLVNSALCGFSHVLQRSLFTQRTSIFEEFKAPIALLLPNRWHPYLKALENDF